MPEQKTETLTVRLTLEVKDALRETAAFERRSLANMLEVMIRDYRSRHAAMTPTRQDGSDHGSTR
jgi:hypothetical protein